MINPKLIDKKNWEEHYIKKGDPTKPTYYICRRKFKVTGLFSRYRLMMGHVRHALSNGWIPVIDMQNYSNAYLAPEKEGKENSWEYYFEQPMRVGLEEAYNGENIILSNGDHVDPYPGHGLDFLYGKNDSLAEWRGLVKAGFMKVKPERMEEILETHKKLFSPEDRVLGVLLRGTDYVVRKLPGHPIPPSIELALSTVTKKLQEWNCNKIFLATEDKSIVERFKENFGEQCAILDRVYVDYNPETDKSVAMSRIDRENDQFIQGKDYLTQMMLLTMCKSFVAARCGGTTSVAIMGENFEHTYFFNLGRYT